MFVRVKKEIGNYGHRCNGIVTPRNWDSGAFEVEDSKGRELLSRGIVVEAAGAEIAPAAKQPARQTASEAEEPSLEQLREQARQRGIKGYARMSRSKLESALTAPEEEDGAPTPNAMAAVE